MDKIEPTISGIDSAWDDTPITALFDSFDASKFRPGPVHKLRNESIKNKPTAATDNQVGGKHYTELGVQPLEATFLNFGYDGLRASIYTKVGKYLTREKGTHRKDITKAIHCLELQLEYLDRSTDK